MYQLNAGENTEVYVSPVCILGMVSWLNSGINIQCLLTTFINKYLPLEILPENY